MMNLNSDVMDAIVTCLKSCLTAEDFLWDKLLFHSEITTNSLSTAVRIQRKDGSLLGNWQLPEEQEELLYEHLEALQEDIRNQTWDEFVILLTSANEVQVDYYYKEKTFLYSSEKTDYFEYKYLGIPLDPTIQALIDNPNAKDVTRTKVYHRENSEAYLRLYAELSELSFVQLWSLYMQPIKDHRAVLYNNLRAGCRSSRLEQLEAIIGFELPQDFKALYAMNDGENDKEDSGIFYGLNFMPLQEVEREWRIWTDLLDSMDEGEILQCSRNCISYPEQAIKDIYADKRWIPFINDFGGNFIGMDLDPDTHGTEGQIINFGRDEDEKIVIADSLKDFIILLIYLQRTEKINKESYALGVEYGHFTDWLKSKYLVPIDKNRHYI
ncbi:SMI1/KNR4 family protein [Paenibacillus sp. MER TA 81-3]|nr:SMI1/KNR4 family protein [Paenibacillus sp. MER TA 81-3]